MKPHSLKLYQSSSSPNSRRIRIYLAEKGICMPMVPVDLGAKEQFSDAYAATNSRNHMHGPIDINSPIQVDSLGIVSAIQCLLEDETDRSM